MLEDAKGILKEKDENGNSVYEHLISVVQKVIESKANCYEDLEQVSSSIKKQKQEKNVVISNKIEIEELQAYVSSSLKLCGKPEAPKISSNEEETEESNKEEEETQVEIDHTKVANIMKNVQMLQWSGIDFGSDWWALQCACYQLAKTFPKIIEPRFFGKIFGLENDFWIVEAKLEEYPEANETTDEPKMEQFGQGLNTYVYFACTNLENCHWNQLPYITPKALIQSKECHIQLKGNLKAKIGGRYKFEGEEELYLRCLIARISSSTIIAPENYYSKEEENEDPLAFILNEEFTIPESIELNSWVI
jgi:radial spoke head protein 4A